MKKSEVLEEIQISFRQTLEEIKKESQAQSWDYKAQYRRKETPENMIVCTGKLKYEGYAVLFNYTLHGMLCRVNSILDCMIAFPISEKTLVVPMSFVVDVLNLDLSQAGCFLIPYITNGSIMKQSLFQIYESVSKLNPRIKELAEDPVQLQQLQKIVVQAYIDIVGDKLAPEELPDFMGFYNYLRDRSTSNAYLYCLIGESNKSLSMFRKFKQKTQFEKKIIERIETTPCLEPQVSNEIQRNIRFHIQKNFKTAIKETFSATIPILVLSIFFTAVLFGVFALFAGMEKSNALYVAGPIGMVPLLVIPGFLLGICFGYFAKEKGVQLIYRKEYWNRMEIDAITSSARKDRRMDFITRLVMLLSIFFTVLLSRCNLRFESNGFIDNSGLFSIKGDYHPYADIEQVIPNDKHTSYLLQLKNGKEIDLYLFEDPGTTKEQLFPILKKKGILVKE
ncbi:MAG: hypothetical protein RR491_06215 [Lachnospiraceae bacterium]